MKCMLGHSDLTPEARPACQHEHAYMAFLEWTWTISWANFKKTAASS